MVIEVVIVSLESITTSMTIMLRIDIGIYLNDFGQMVLRSETVGFKSCDFGHEFNSPLVQLKLKMQQLEIVQSN
jgi:hypothetical protein